MSERVTQAEIFNSQSIKKDDNKYKYLLMKSFFFFKKTLGKIITHTHEMSEEETADKCLTFCLWRNSTFYCCKHYKQVLNACTVKSNFRECIEQDRETEREKRGEKKCFNNHDNGEAEEHSKQKRNNKKNEVISLGNEEQKAHIKISEKLVESIKSVFIVMSWLLLLFPDSLLLANIFFFFGNNFNNNNKRLLNLIGRESGKELACFKHIWFDGLEAE